MTNDEKIVLHAGVKGMKWGKRKKQSSDYKEKRAIGKRRASTLSNEQLEKYNTRVNLEKKYKSSKKKIDLKKIAAVLTTVMQIVGGLTAAAAAAKVVGVDINISPLAQALLGSGSGSTPSTTIANIP